MFKKYLLIAQDRLGFGIELGGDNGQISVILRTRDITIWMTDARGK
jgi:hypothetical protein